MEETDFQKVCKSISALSIVVLLFAFLMFGAFLGSPRFLINKLAVNTDVEQKVDYEVGFETKFGTFTDKDLRHLIEVSLVALI